MDIFIHGTLKECKNCILKYENEIFQSCALEKIKVTDENWWKVILIKITKKILGSMKFDKFYPILIF